MGISYHRLDNAITRHCRQEWQDLKRVHDAAQGPESKPSRTFRDVLDVPPPRFAKPIPKGAGKGSGCKRWLLIPDLHFPFQDDTVLPIYFSLIRDLKPHGIIVGGDLVDCWQISSFDKNPARLDTLQNNIDQARGFLHQVSDLAPNAEKHLLEGNHEERLTKTIWKLKDAARALATLRVFENAMTWPNLLDLDDIGWEFIPVRAQSKTPILPKLILKHGTVVRKWSGWSAKGEYEKYGRSGVSFHTHRLGAFIHRDHNGSHVWLEGGCGCRLDPEYGTDFDWHQGATVLTYSPDGERYSWEFCYVQDGRAFWREREYAA